MDKPEHAPDAQPDWSKRKPDYKSPANVAARKERRKNRTRGGRKAPRPPGKKRDGPRKGEVLMNRAPPALPGESKQKKAQRMSGNIAKFSRLKQILR